MFLFTTSVWVGGGRRIKIRFSSSFRAPALYFLLTRVCRGRGATRGPARTPGGGPGAATPPHPFPDLSLGAPLQPLRSARRLDSVGGAGLVLFTPPQTSEWATLCGQGWLLAQKGIVGKASQTRSTAEPSPEACLG